MGADKEQMQQKKQTTMRSFADTKKGQAVIKSQTEKGIDTKPKKKGGNADKGDSDGEDDEEASDGAAPQAKASAKKTPAPFKKKEGKEDADKPKKQTKQR